VQVHGTIIDTVDVDLGVRPFDAVQMRGQRGSIVVQPMNWGTALPPYFHDSILAISPFVPVWVGLNYYYIPTS
jgi:hypothetical protein